MDAAERLPEELLTAVPAILAAEEEGSATRVAARFGTTTATVLRRLEAAESALGVRLFERLPTGLEATPALATVLPWARQIAASCDGIRRDVAGLDVRPRGHVRVAVPPTVASHLLVPRIGALRRRFPDLVVEFDTATSLVDLGQREADIAVRGRKPEDGDLVRRKLGDYRMAVVGAPRLAKRCLSAQELPWLDWERGSGHLESRWLEAVVPEATVALRASELGTLLRAARAGVGALLAPVAVAALEGGLVEVVLPGVEPPSGSVWLVTHRALRQVPRIDAVWTWLEEVFDRVEGEHELRRVG